MADRHDDVSFEPRDVKVGPIFGFLVVLSLGLVVAMVGLWWLQASFLRTTVERAPELPPEPRVEGVGLNRASHSVTNRELPTSARSQRMREDLMLKDGWIDAAGKRHPPITIAMKNIVEKAR